MTDHGCTEVYGPLGQTGHLVGNYRLIDRETRTFASFPSFKPELAGLALFHQFKNFEAVMPFAPPWGITFARSCLHQRPLFGSDTVSAAPGVAVEHFIPEDEDLGVTELGTESCLGKHFPSCPPRCGNDCYFGDGVRASRCRRWNRSARGRYMVFSSLGFSTCDEPVPVVPRQKVFGMRTKRGLPFTRTDLPAVFRKLIVPPGHRLDTDVCRIFVFDRSSLPGKSNEIKISVSED